MKYNFSVKFGSYSNPQKNKLENSSSFIFCRDFLSRTCSVLHMVLLSRTLNIFYIAIIYFYFRHKQLVVAFRSISNLKQETYVLLKVQYAPNKYLQKSCHFWSFFKIKIVVSIWLEKFSLSVKKIDAVLPFPL